tara:strand:- start:551 stop:748 length:198 start_codon:yes stop_codon:yes gene_type:complete
MLTTIGETVLIKNGESYNEEQFPFHYTVDMGEVNFKIICTKIACEALEHNDMNNYLKSIKGKWSN